MLAQRGLARPSRHLQGGIGSEALALPLGGVVRGAADAVHRARAREQFEHGLEAREDDRFRCALVTGTARRGAMANGIR